MSIEAGIPDIDEPTFRKVFAKHLGVDEQTLKPTYVNPVHQEVISELEHSDLFGL